MTTKTFSGSRLRKAEWDAATRQLDIHWANGTVQAYKQVPDEVFRRLCAAPNPATYWEDRIADEYPQGHPRKAPERPDPEQAFKSLFGGGGAGTES